MVNDSTYPSNVVLVLPNNNIVHDALATNSIVVITTDTDNVHNNSNNDGIAVSLIADATNFAASGTGPSIRTGDDNNSSNIYVMEWLFLLLKMQQIRLLLVLVQLSVLVMIIIVQT